MSIHRLHIYALSATYYYAISGKIPTDSIDRINGDRLVPPTELGAKISRETEAVITKGLSLQGVDRFQSMKELRSAFDVAIEAERSRRELELKKAEEKKLAEQQEQERIVTKHQREEEKRRFEEKKRIKKERREEDKRQLKEKRLAAKTAKKEEKEQIRLQREAQRSLNEHKHSFLKIAVPVIAVVTAVALLIPFVIIPGVDYSKATQLFNDGNYEDAKVAFEDLGDFKDSPAQAEACEEAITEREYTKAIELMNNGEYESAITILESLNGYKDSAVKIESCNNAIAENLYNSAVELREAGSSKEAIEVFSTLGDYKDSSEQITNIMGSRQYIKNCDVGDTLFFGSYEQDNNLENGAEPIEWQVLEKKNDKILVISKYGLDSQPYNTSNTSVTWESCSLRKWLNGTFIDNAFDITGKDMIADSNVPADENPYYDTNPGNSTTDKVFLLSVTEAEKYFSSNEDRKCVPTAYAIEQGAYYYTYTNTNKSLLAQCWSRNLFNLIKVPIF